MGHIVKVTCPKCSLNKELRLGHGINDYKLENIITYFPEDTVQQIVLLKKEEKIKFYDFNKCIGICQACKQLSEAPLLEITLHSGNKIQYGATCTYCEANLTIIHDEITKNAITCPYCEKSNLEVNNVGYWD